MEHELEPLEVEPMTPEVSPSPSPVKQLEEPEFEYFEEPEFEYFYNFADVQFDSINSKCLIFSIIEEYLRLKGLVLDEWIRKRLEFVIEPNWRKTYIKTD